jgi:uncharacterized protein YxjI
MKNIQYPVSFKFHVTTFSNDFTATDASGETLAYVRQKMFKLKEKISIYSDKSRNEVNYTIKADRWLDFSAAYSFYNAEGNLLGKVARKGWQSMWKAKYLISDNSENQEFTIEEDNGFVKMLDSVLGGIPVLSFFTGYLFNPSYSLKDNNGKAYVQMKKEPSFFGRKFKLKQLSNFKNEHDDQRILLGYMMMVLLERKRG